MQAMRNKYSLASFIPPFYIFGVASVVSMGKGKKKLIYHMFNTFMLKSGNTE